MTKFAYAGLWIFIFSVPWERIIVLPGLSIVTRATGGLALALTALAVVVTGRFRRWRVFHVAALLFVVWTGIGVWVLQAWEIPAKFYTFAQLFLVVWMIWELAATAARQMGLLTAYVLGAYVAAIDTILLYLRQAGALRRFAAGGADPNSLAMTLALGLPMAWYLGMTYRRPLLRWMCRGYVVVGLVAIGLTGSRGGMLASVVALSIVPLTLGKLSPGRRAAAICLLMVSGAVAAAYVPETLVQRFATTGSEVQEGKLGGRFQIWAGGVKAFAQKPLMGYGTGNFKPAVRPWGGVQVAHNSYLSVLVEEGLVGFTFFATMLVSALLAVLRLRGMERRFALILWATLGIAILPLTWEDQKEVWFTMSALVGLAAAPAAGLNRGAGQARARPFAPVARVPLRPVRQPASAGRLDPDATA